MRSTFNSILMFLPHFKVMHGSFDLAVVIIPSEVRIKLSESVPKKKKKAFGIKLKAQSYS